MSERSSHMVRLLLVSTGLFLQSFFHSVPVTGQISHGGIPASFHTGSLRSIPTIDLPVPDMDQIRAEDTDREKMAEPVRVAAPIRTNIDLNDDGQWEVLSDGTRIWRISLHAEGALGLGLYFDAFRLNEGDYLFIYDEQKQFLKGAYTSFNNKQNLLFAVELISGESITIELNQAPGSHKIPVLSLSEISYVYRDFPEHLRGTTSADFCEVNINCPEGDNWQKQKRGVVKIYVKESAGFFWCTGSLVNNTAQDFEPFLLTADHCASNVTPDDLAQWIFYFNFEAPGCENPAITPPATTMTGAQKLSSASTNGSDFLLIRLDEEIPVTYEPYFNGWNAENIPGISGVTIHHPAGDIKKISTYTEPMISSQWGSIPNTHWQVVWTETENGWGVTEGGSSGAPLFDHNGRIIGNLTGGLSSCTPGGTGTGPDQPDYFGKFSFSWDQNGSSPEQQLKYWLDPGNTGVTSMPGTNAALTAGFMADETILLAGNPVLFTNLSSGLPDYWEWTFEGGNPSTYLGKNPPEIYYAHGGAFDVGLVVSDGILSDSLFLNDYIHIVGRIYPNPAREEINLYLDADLPAFVKTEVFNSLGQKLDEKEFPDQSIRLITLDVSHLSAGVYAIRLTVKQRYIFGKFLKY